jgi:glycine/D-amino acid oxidase-like deaminating enzyme
MRTNKLPDFDVIIVGQGIAGTVLGIQLIQQGYKICMIDACAPSSSSLVAAGIYNPVVFKRFTETKLADVLLNKAIPFYIQAEKTLQSKFIHQTGIVKPLNNEELVFIQQKKANFQYINKLYHQVEFSPLLHQAEAWVEIQPSGWVDTINFLSSAQNFFLQHASYLIEPFEYSLLKFVDNEVLYKDVSAEKIVFCEGFNASHHPFFPNMPFKLAKGEVFEISVGEKIHFQSIINSGVYLVPLSAFTFKVGATYEWNDLTPFSTENGKLQLIDKLNSILKIPFEIIRHEAGVRPATVDRNPILGSSQNYSNAFIFNGLGTKGILNAPYLAEKLIQSMMQNATLNAEWHPYRRVVKK